MTNEIKLRDFTIGNDENLSLMGGMNVLESRDLAMNVAEEFVKASSIQNQIVLASIDATQQNIKTFNDNAKSFVELNKNILQSWISAFATKNN